MLLFSSPVGPVVITLNWGRTGLGRKCHTEVLCQSFLCAGQGAMRQSILEIDRSCYMPILQKWTYYIAMGKSVLLCNLT